MTSGRVRALTRKPRRLEVIAKDALDVVRLQMELHLAAGRDYLSIDHHKADSQYDPTYIYQESWEIGHAHLTGSGLVGTLSNDVVDDRGRHYAIYVAGTETEESPQADDWVGPWNQLKDALRGTQPTFRQRIVKAIREAIARS